MKRSDAEVIIIGNMVEVRGGTVEIQISGDRLWINVNGVCRLRAFNAEIVLPRDDDREGAAP